LSPTRHHSSSFEAMLNLVSNTDGITFSGAIDEIGLHPVIPSALPHATLGSRMPPEKNLINSVSVRFDLAHYSVRKTYFPFVS